MNVVVIVSDTFRRDHVGIYGVPAPWQHAGHPDEPFTRTPNLDHLASQSALFERFYAGSYPTVPCRYDLFSGRFGFTTRGWQELEPHDVILSELLSAKDVPAMMIFDTPMLATDSYNYTRGFAGWEFVRGQHADRYNIDEIDSALPASPHKVKAGTLAYLRNAHFRRSEKDWMCAQTCQHAMDWLERNRLRDGFLLWVDMWDPHEPFDAPTFDLERFVDPSFSGERVIYPRYGRGSYMSDAELAFVRASYAALVTAADRWIGNLLAKITAVGLDENTMIVFLSDHGHLFGDHELQGKPTGQLGRLYEVTTRVPMMIRHPEGIGAGTRVEGIAQHPDLLPTILEFFELPTPSDIHGLSLWPLIRGERNAIREFAVSGRHSQNTGGSAASRVSTAGAFDGAAGLETPGEPVTITTPDWAYVCLPQGLGASELYDLRTDPGQSRNVVDENAEVARGLHNQLVHFLGDHGMPDEMLDRYKAGMPHQSGGAAALLAAETLLFAARDDDGRRFAFLSREEAEVCFPNFAFDSITIGDLREADPRALIGVGDQYYWCEDLV
jgi:arylsulfatase A-like enzyme